MFILIYIQIISILNKQIQQLKKLRFYSITGRLYIQIANKRINISDLAEGIYLVKINTQTNKSITKKIIKTDYLI